MPRQYEAMRDKFAAGAPVDSPKYNAAQGKAARIYNSKHPDNPVTGRSEGKKKRSRSAKKRKSRPKKSEFDYMRRY